MIAGQSSCAIHSGSAIGFGASGEPRSPSRTSQHRASRAAQGARDLAQTASFRQSSPDLLVPLHRHAPKRHAAVSFVVAHEGCGSWQLEFGDQDLTHRKHRIGRRRQIIDRIGSPCSGAATPPLASGTPKNPAHMVNRDIGRPLPSMPKRPPQVVPN